MTKTGISDPFRPIALLLKRSSSTPRAGFGKRPFLPGNGKKADECERTVSLVDSRVDYRNGLALELSTVP